MDGIAFGMSDVAEVIDRLADYIEYAAQSSFAYRHRNWSAGIDGFHSAHHAVGWDH